MSISFDDLRAMADKQTELAHKYRKELGFTPHAIEGNFIAFLGRQFSPNYFWNRALKPLWGGIYIKYNNLELMIDPGINTLQRAQHLGINLSKTNALFISHAHTDHANDANVVSEMVTYRNTEDLKLLMSKKTLDDGVINQYHLNLHTSKNAVNLLEDRKTIELGEDISITPIKVCHSIEGSFGFLLDLKSICIGYTADTGFYKTYKTQTGSFPVEDIKNKEEVLAPGIFNDELIKVFQKANILAFNLHDVDFRAHSAHSLYHSTVPGAIELLKNSSIDLCIFDHFNPHGSLGADYPNMVHQYIKEQTKKLSHFVGLEGRVISI